jgi:hypothetical protein
LKYRLAKGVEEGLEWACQVRDWGYEREFIDGEVETSAWVRYGDVIAWFSKPASDPGALTLCLCAAPEARGGIINDETFAVACLVAELLGADRILFELAPPESKYQVPSAIEMFCLRYGYERTETGWVYDLEKRPRVGGD